MQLLRTNTATRITVGPFFDKTDGVTPEVAITVTAEKLTFIVDTGGVPTLILDAAPTASGGANDMVHITGDDAGYYDLELAAADVNYLGRAKLALTDATVHCPVFHEYMIIPAMVYDALVLGTDTLQSDTVQWLGTACATPTTNGVPEVDVTHVAGTAQTAGDLKNDLNTLLTRIPTLVKVDMETVINAYEPAKISVSGRLFDVSANGNVGIDWNNIDNPTTTQNLSGTTVSAVSGATGSVTGNVGGDVLGSVAALGVNAVNNNSIHSNACAKISDSGIQRGASNWENNADNRSLAWAISKLVNKVDLNAAGDTLTIRKSNDSTALFTQAVTVSGGASPITALDTA